MRFIVHSMNSLLSPGPESQSKWLVTPWSRLSTLIPVGSFCLVGPVVKCQAHLYGLDPFPTTVLHVHSVSGESVTRGFRWSFAFLGASSPGHRDCLSPSQLCGRLLLPGRQNREETMSAQGSLPTGPCLTLLASLGTLVLGIRFVSETLPSQPPEPCLIFFLKERLAFVSSQN